MTEKDFEIVEDHLKSQGITVYSLYKANNCIGVSYDRISCYYYVKDGKVVNIVYD